MKTVKNKNQIDVQNIMTLTLNTETISNKDARILSWEFEIEDEGKRTGTSLDQLKSFITAMSYVLHNVDPSNAFRDALAFSQPEMVCHIYSHDLAALFHWLRNIFNDNMSVFTNTWMNPITADIYLNNVTFRLHDTSRLVPKTIDEWAADEDLSGNIVLEGMKLYRTKYRYLYNIPVTQAGEVRREFRKKVTDKKWLTQTNETIKSYTLETYRDLVACFMGGTLGVNESYRNMLLSGVFSDDLGSAYPGVMVTRKFPVSPWEDAEYEPSDDYRYYLTVKFINPTAKGMNKFYPFKKCDDSINPVDEGIALQHADEVTLTMTDIDFEIFKRTYTYDSYEILKCRRSKADYLPTQLVKLMLKNYNEKTLLKGTDQVSKYREAKVKNNCAYGVAVTKTITDDITFVKGEWKKHEIKTEEDFIKARDNLLKSKQVLSYQIGVWVTAYVREMMWAIIPNIDSYVVYFDTDCIKHTNKTDIFKEINKIQMTFIKQAAAHHDIEISKFMPKNKPIGCFEEEAYSHEFKALDIKKYAKRTDEGIEAFISGMPKDHINLHSVKDFKNNMKWSSEESGRFNIYYNEGNNYSVSVTPAPFKMKDYNDYELLILISGGTLRSNKTQMFRGL